MAGIVNEAYTLDVNVQEGGAAEATVNVRAWNVADTSVIDKTTDAGGDITATILTAEQHSITVTSTRATTVYNPFRLRSLKWGLQVLQVSINLSAPSKQTLFMASNANLTQTVQATVQAYTGITFTHASDLITLDGTGITPVNNMDRLYDRCQDEAIVAEQSDFAESLFTLDGQNYTSFYDLTITGFAFAGQSRSILMDASQIVTIAGTGGNVSALTITGDVVITTADADLANVTINGDLTIEVRGTYSFTNVTVSGDVVNTDSGVGSNVQINLSGGSLSTSEPGTGDGQVNIVTSVPITFEVDDGISAIENALITAYLVSDDSEVINALSNASGIVTTTFAGTTPADMYYRYRKNSTGAQKYENLSGLATIATGTGSTVKRSMVKDTISDPSV